MNFCASVFPQNCGGSIRTISFEFSKNVKKPEKIYYKMFYLLPKRDDRYLNYSSTYAVFRHEVAVHLWNFLYDNPSPLNDYFWIGKWDADEKFIQVSPEKAQKYLSKYR